MKDILTEIYAATNSGLDIILAYYPQAADSVDHPGRGFKIRNEAAPSAYMKKLKGVWRVTDFGDSDHALSPIDVVMKEEGIEFNEALSLLAARYGISDRLDEQCNRAQVEARPATDEEPEGFFDYETHPLTKDELRTLGNGVKEEHATALSFYALTWYRMTKNRKTVTVFSNENFPIFMRECHTNGESFFKILKPLEPKKEYRFIYLGEKEPNYVNGLFELRKAHAKFVSDHENDDENEGKGKPTKLPECVICSGERDAVCCLSRGYHPIWLNSETAELTPGVFHSLQSMCEKVCLLPDIDETGLAKAREKALEFLDLHTIMLPDSLRQHRDRRGNPCKDMRDWCEFHTAPREFQKLADTARSCKFWREKKTKDGLRTELDVVSLLWFLEMNGYARLVDPQTMKERIIRIAQDNIVSEVTENNIRDFLLTYCNLQHLPLDVQRTLISSRMVSGVLDALPIVNETVCFRNHTASSQFFRFENDSVEVTATDVRKCKAFHVWESDVCRHRFKRLKPSFTLSDGGEFTINDDSSLFFRFCINSSRLYWRKEFEAAAAASDTTYADDCHFTVFGHYLTDGERIEQTRCLLAKMYAIGYLLLSAIVLTHAHFDHILGVKKLSDRFGIPVYLHPDDRQMLKLAPSMAAGYDYMPVPDISFETCDIKDGQILKIGDVEFEVIHTPGHTPGSVCLLARESGDLFSGDTLFAGSIGRTDIPMGDYDKEIVSVMEKIMGLDADIKVHPGHGGATTIGYERTHNPFLQPFNEKDDQGNVDGIEFNG